MTPDKMPRKGSGLTTVKRERHIVRDCGCCDVFVTERVRAIRGATHRSRPPVAIRNTALADALRAKGF